MLDEKDLISIIVPVYNVEKYLDRCIDSIINQTYKNIEIILVDDGSTDQSSIICDKYSKLDKRIKTIHKKNGGLSSARNTGLDIAKGNLLGFVDGDDYIDSNMIEELYKNIIKTKADIVICNFVRFDEEKETFNKYSKKKFIVEEKDKYNYLFNEYRIPTVVQWNKLFKKEVFKDIEYKKGKINEDEFTVCSELNNAKRISYYLEPFYHYYQRNNSIMGSYNINRFETIFEAYDSQINFFKNKSMDNEIINTKLVRFEAITYFLYMANKSNMTKKPLKKYIKKTKSIAKDVLIKYRSNFSLKKQLRFFVYILSPSVYNYIVYNKNRIKESN